MKKITFFALLFTLVACQSPREEKMKLMAPVSFADVEINDDFWTPRLLIHKDVTLPVCIDQIENQTGRIRNFENAAKGAGEHSGIFFDDSDVYKALEGMAYSLQIEPDPELEAKCNEWVDNPEGFDGLQLTEGMEFRMEKLPQKQWWGHEILQITARNGEEELVLIPYFAWDNREAGKMKVWIPFK